MNDLRCGKEDLGVGNKNLAIGVSPFAWGNWWHQVPDISN